MIGRSDFCMIKMCEINRLFVNNTTEKLNDDTILKIIGNYLKDHNEEIIGHKKNCRYVQRLINNIRKLKHKKLIFDLSIDIMLIYTTNHGIVFNIDLNRCEFLIPSGILIACEDKCKKDFVNVTDHFIDRLIFRATGKVENIVKMNNVENSNLVDKVSWYIINNSYPVKRKVNSVKGTIYRSDGKMIYAIENNVLITCYPITEINKNNYVKLRRP